MIMHVKDASPDSAMHISHIHGLVSAYYSSPEMVNDLVVAILEAHKVAKETHYSQVVDQAGHMFLLVHPSGTFDLCVPIRHLEFLTEEEVAKL
jgi:hypothetical protein